MLTLASHGVMAGEGDLGLPIGNMSLGLNISLDRKEYLQWEPVFVEATMTNHGKSGVRVVQFGGAGGDLLSLSYRCMSGKAMLAGMGKVVCVDMGAVRKMQLPTFQPRQKCVLWQDIRNRVDLRKAGQFKLDVIYDTTKFESVKGVWASILTSNEVEFEVVLPENEEDAKASGIVDKAVKNLKTPSLSNLYESNPELCRKILAETHSSRFAAVASFYLAQNIISDLEFHTSNKQKKLDEAIGYLEKCVQSDSSPYLKGLAKYYILQCKLDSEPKPSNDEVRKMSNSLIKEHPDTFAAMKAKEILDALK